MIVATFIALGILDSLFESALERREYTIAIAIIVVAVIGWVFVQLGRRNGPSVNARADDHGQANVIAENRFERDASIEIKQDNG